MTVATRGAQRVRLREPTPPIAQTTRADATPLLAPASRHLRLSPSRPYVEGRRNLLAGARLCCLTCACPELGAWNAPTAWVDMVKSPATGRTAAARCHETMDEILLASVDN